MKHKILPILIAATALTGCSTIYKSGQTPDDVYYSPLKKYEEKKEEDKRDEQAQAEEQQEQRQQSVVRYGVNDRRWRDFDNDWEYDRYDHRCNCYCNTYGYGYYNNPFFTPRPYFYPTYVPRGFTPVVNNTPRMVNLQAYKPSSSGNYVKGGNNQSGLNSRRSYNKGNSTFGDAIRRIITPSSSSQSSGGSNNNRTYSPTNSGSSGGSSSGGSSGGGSSVTRPGRGG